LFLYVSRRIKCFVSTPERKRFLENFLSLSILQGANYLLPLIAFPYLVRVLGPDKFGLIAFAYAFIQYFVLLTDFGFNISAVREISVNRESKEKLSEIFSSVMTIKFSIMILSFALLSVVIFTFNKFQDDWVIYYLMFGVVIGNALFPVWFFQGMERMKYITLLNILSKIIFTVGIFVVIREVTDYIYVPLFYSAGFIVSGIISFYIVLKDFKIELKFIKIRNLINIAKENLHFFLGSISGSLMNNTGTFIVGIFFDINIVGYYAAIEKIVLAFKSIFFPLMNTLYPYLSKKYIDKDNNIFKIYKKLYLGHAIIGLSIFSLTLLFAKNIVLIILGSDYNFSINILRSISLIFLISPLTIVLGVPSLLPLDLKKWFTASVYLPVLFFLIASITVLSFYTNIFIYIYLFLLTECLVLFTRTVALNKYGYLGQIIKS